jgi:membrane-bound metal-dependent hydrolase YbcI (DUF457 family)
MKGLTHFLSGVAVSSFFHPAVVKAAATRTGLEGAEASFILLLGGLFGIMPDTLDFKLGQFFSKAEVDVDCDPQNPDPQTMARQIGEAIDHVWETGEYRRVQLYPMRLGANLWRQYVIQFDGEANEVIVVINEVVSTSQVPFVGTAPPEEKRVGRYKLKANLLETHGRPSVVDILSGPQYGFRKEGDAVTVEFLPWHRTWSHSYLLGLMLALPVWLIAWLAGLSHWPLYGLIAFLGFAVHITEDLTGHMGGSLFWPLFRRRSDGLALFRASDPGANFSVDLAAVVITIYNLDRFTTRLITWPWYAYFLVFLVLPLAVYWGLAKGLAPRERAPRRGIAVAAEALAAERARLRNEELLYEDDGIRGG